MCKSCYDSDFRNDICLCGNKKRKTSNICKLCKYKLSKNKVCCVCNKITNKSTKNRCPGCYIKYLKNNNEEYRKRANKKMAEYNLNRYYSDPTYKEKILEGNRKRRNINNKNKIDHRIGNSIRKDLNKRCINKKHNWEKLVGYTINDLVDHLISKMPPDMTVEDLFDGNIVHIDHIKARSRFTYDSADDVEFKKCWSLENLRPLWAIDNLKKGNK